MRYMNIGLAVGVTIVIVGVIVFRHSSDAAMQAMALIGMVIGLAVGLGLDTRAQRGSGRRTQ